MDPLRDTVTLSRAEVESLNQKLADMRHTVNNCLGLITASADILERKPERLPRIIEHFHKQPDLIVQEMMRFTDEFERILRVPEMTGGEPPEKPLG